MAKIQIQNITKRFDDKLVLDNISFNIEKGEIFGLIGPNGAGKSTLLNVIIGMLNANSGQVLIDGKTIQENSVAYKGKIGFVPQEIALLEELSVYDNLEYFGVYYGLFGKKLKVRINKTLEIARLSDQPKQKVKNLSGGLKRRLNIAVAMLHEPEILIMDEPTVGVDAQSRNYIFDFIRKINHEDKVTVIYTSHYMEEVEQLCRRIFIIDNGKKISHGTKSEIKALIYDTRAIRIKVDKIVGEFIDQMKLLDGVQDITINDHESFIISANTSFRLEALIQVCQQYQMNLVGIHFEDPSLEEVFLSLTGKRLRD